MPASRARAGHPHAGHHGLTATEIICAEPDLAGTHILIVTTFETDEYVARALRA